MKLVGLYASPFVRRVAVTMNHHGLAFERKILSVFTDFDELLELSPLGKVPVLILDNGESLFDSRIIVTYLDQLMPEQRRLLPEAPADLHRQVLRAEAVAVGLAEKSYERGIELARRNQENLDSRWSNRFKQQIVSALIWLEKQAPDPWMCGGKMTQADISFAVAFTYLREKQQIRLRPGDYPALDALCDRCEALPEFLASPYSTN